MGQEGWVGPGCHQWTGNTHTHKHTYTLATVHTYCEQKCLQCKTHPRTKTLCSHKVTETEQMTPCIQVPWYIKSLKHTRTWWHPRIVRGLAMGICYGEERETDWEGRTEQEGSREREINIDSWESPLFLNYPCFPALVCVCWVRESKLLSST